MNFRNTVGVVILLILLVIASCKEPDGIGLDVLPAGEEMPIAWVDTFTIEARTVGYDSVLTSGLTTYLLGDFGDPIFGRVKSDLYTQLRLESVPFDPGAGQTIDSIVLNMAYSGSYGNTTKFGGTMRFGVYELTEDLISLVDTSYYSTVSHSVDPIALAEFDLRPDLFSGITMIGGGDTVLLPPSLRIRLDDSFGQDILNLGGGSTELADNDEFVKAIKGISVRPINASMVSGNGSILYLNLASEASRVELYYHNNNDTSSVILTMNNTGSVHTFFEHEFPLVINNAIADSTVEGANRLYVQSMAGLRMRLDIPHLRELRELGVVAITKAELVVPIDETVITDYGYPSSLFVTGINDDGGSVILVDQFESSDYYGGVFNSDEGEYVFNIARHIQSILNSPEEPDLGLYVVNAGNSTNARRGVFNGPQHPDKAMKLRMTYTIVE
ncbi:MAG: hypothetical protein ACJAYA_001400 [Bacteroidia bacterium]|jgi:hypothetical protein